MSRSLRTIPAGALAACAVVLLTTPQAEAAAARAGRAAATAPRPAVSAGPHAPGHPDGRDADPLPPHGWGATGAHHRTDDKPHGARPPADGPRAGVRPPTERRHHTWGDGDRGRSEDHRPRHGARDADDDAVRRPHGAPGESPAPSGVPGAASDGGGDGETHHHASRGRAEGPRTVDGPDWLAPVAPPADPLVDSQVWRPAGSAPDQALDAPQGRAVGQNAAAMPPSPVLPVLTFGAGLTSLGLGIAFFALRLRRD